MEYTEGYCGVVFNFFDPLEVLPEDEEVKIVICRTKKNVATWNRAYYSNGLWHGSGSMSGVVAWADMPQELVDYLAGVKGGDV